MMDAFVIRKPEDEDHVKLLERKLNGYKRRLEEKKQSCLYNPPEVNFKDEVLAYLTYSVALLTLLLDKGEIEPEKIFEREFDSGLENEEWFNGVYNRLAFEIAVNNILVYSKSIRRLASKLRENE